jgi:translation initiation factor IF-2
LAKRIFEIAKELGIESKAIVTKCQAEGIPESVVKNHMSSISVGLEATIREWFSGGGTATAVETTEKVDVEQVRTRVGVRRKAAGHDHDDAPATATPHPEVSTHATHPAEERHEHHRVEEAPAPVAVAAEPPPAAKPVPQVASEEPPAAPEETAPAPITASPTPAPTPAPVHHHTPAPTPRPTVAAPPSSLRPTPVRIEPTRVEVTSEPAQPARAAAQAPSTDRPRDGGAPGGGSSRPGYPSRAGVPPVMNVPQRPTNVAPAGPQLVNRAPVKLSGPKVVRVEAPEVIEAPRPRRVGPSGPTGPGRPGGGAGTSGGEGGEDDRRNARRKAGGGPPPGAGGGAGAGAGTKRSSGMGVPQRRRATSGAEWVGGQAGVFSEQDLIEREARLVRSSGLLKKRRLEQKRQEGQEGADQGPAEGRVRIAAPFTVKDLSEVTGVKAAEIVKKLFLQGVMATINSGIDPAKAQEIMIDFDIDLEVVEARTAEEAVSDEYSQREAVDLRPRGPVVTILGHVDHGKTSLLDKIRNANVAAGEAGGITQRTSAFRVPLKVGGEEKTIVFLDTPGHEAFTSMRSRGATMTDVVVLVVSAPEGVMPQTVESINHAKAAKVPIVVALNKIDRADATDAVIQKTLGQLATAGLNPTEWGGDTDVIRTSATTGKGIPELLEALDYQAQLRDLKADFGGHARGTVIEAKTEEGRGAVANILVQDGKLKVGDFVVAGRAYGRVRDITDDRGQRLREVVPPIPVQISGLDEIPDAGDRFYSVDSLKEAQAAAEQRRQREREAQLAQPKVTLDSLFTQMADKDVKEILIVLKAAEQGTVDVLKTEVEKIKTAEVRVRVLHSAVGGIVEADVVLADASKAIIIGFNVIASGKARSLAESKGVEIRTYQVIYDITDDIRKAAEGLLAPELRQEVLGHAEVRKVFSVTKVGKIAGCYVTDGTVQRDALIRVTRSGIVIENNRRLAQLKRVKDDAKEVRAGMECGMKIDGYDDIKEGDILECYKQVEVKRTL